MFVSKSYGYLPGAPACPAYGSVAGLNNKGSVSRWVRGSGAGTPPARGAEADSGSPGEKFVVWSSSFWTTLLETSSHSAATSLFVHVLVNTRRCSWTAWTCYSKIIFNKNQSHLHLEPSGKKLFLSPRRPPVVRNSRSWTHVRDSLKHNTIFLSRISFLIITNYCYDNDIPNFYCYELFLPTHPSLTCQGLLKPSHTPATARFQRILYQSVPHETCPPVGQTFNRSFPLCRTHTS